VRPRPDPGACAHRRLRSASPSGALNLIGRVVEHPIQLRITVIPIWLSKLPSLGSVGSAWKLTNGRDLRQVLADEVQVSFATALPGPTGNRLLDFAQTRHQFG